MTNQQKINTIRKALKSIESIKSGSIERAKGWLHLAIYNLEKKQENNKRK